MDAGEVYSVANTDNFLWKRKDDLKGRGSGAMAPGAQPSHGKQFLGSRTEAYSRNWPHVPAGFWNCYRPVTIFLLYL